MMNKKGFTKFAKQILHPHAGVGRPRPMHPEREWFIGLIIAIIIAAGSATWSTKIYLKYRDTSIIEAGEEVETIVYRGSLVEAALQEFAEREVNLEILLKENTSRGLEETPTEEAILPEEGLTPGAAGQETATSTETLDPTEDRLSTSTGETSSDEEVLTEEVTPEIPPSLSN